MLNKHIVMKCGLLDGLKKMVELKILKTYLTFTLSLYDFLKIDFSVEQM